MKLFILEGSIGVGKSTILEGLGELKFPTFPEPVKEWEPWLRQYYTNQCAEEGVQLQYKILHSVVNRQRAIVSTSAPNIVVERSLLSAREVFVPVNQKKFPHIRWLDVLSEYTKHITICERYETDNNIEIIRIGLDCTFETIQKRRVIRGNPDIDSTVDYLKEIYKASSRFHEQYCDYIISVDDQFSKKECINRVYEIIKQHM